MQMLLLMILIEDQDNLKTNKIMKDTLGKEFYESADKTIKVTKQETLEEASEYFAHNNFNMHDTNNYKALKVGFEEGAKWQQKEYNKQHKSPTT